jgi:putative component of membrane protein insertase Oxa1/YidC/SpoIIIJ protein YidD
MSIHFKKNYLILFVFCLLFVKEVAAQSINYKADLIAYDSLLVQQTKQTFVRPYIYKDKPKTFKNSNPVSLAFGGLLYVYQNYFSQHLSASCLYQPSCSDFSKQAVRSYGIFKGTLLTFDRLSRCNRIAATDLNINDIDKCSHHFYDPVEKYKWDSKKNK